MRNSLTNVGFLALTIALAAGCSNDPENPGGGAGTTAGFNNAGGASGSSGAAGKGGASGKGGAAGTGTAGTGTAGTGTAGTGAAGTGDVECSGILNPGECATCLEGSCCLEVAVCDVDDDCFTCVSNPTSDCENNEAYTGLIACLQASCETECTSGPAESTCNPLTNNGCTTAGTACDTEDNASYQCFQGDNTAKQCEVCSYNSNKFCEPGSHCLLVDNSGDGTCAKYCCDDADCGTGKCDKTLLASDAGDSTIGLCVKALGANTPEAACDAPAYPPSNGACFSAFPGGTAGAGGAGGSGGAAGAGAGGESGAGAGGATAGAAGEAGAGAGGATAGAGGATAGSAGESGAGGATAGAGGTSAGAAGTTGGTAGAAGEAGAGAGGATAGAGGATAGAGGAAAGSAGSLGLLGGSAGTLGGLLGGSAGNN